ncbi:hypothetical protein ATANTOWER_029060 [Ataeniobius toweri]|uniref:Transmembrane protein n=1 Tax=Ataeniobius toweri TaxID=208326 RepID=A0ABU7CM31_9TELE|nr:hypothetical protein [Ataeniobius toweri]
MKHTEGREHVGLSCDSRARMTPRSRSLLQARVRIPLYFAISGKVIQCNSHLCILAFVFFFFVYFLFLFFSFFVFLLCVASLRRSPTLLVSQSSRSQSSTSTSQSQPPPPL